MATINFTITEGALPVAASITNTDNTYKDQFNITEYGSYTFDDVPTGVYIVTVTDNNGCSSTKDVSVSHECSEGQIMTAGGCVSYVEESSTVISEPYIAVKVPVNSDFTMYGGIIFDTYLLNGTGTPEPFSNNYVVNSPYPSESGALNDTAIWVSEEEESQEISIPITIEVAVEQTYYIGFASGGETTIKVNGVEVMHQDVDAIKTMINDNELPGGYDDTVLYKYWFVYPIILEAGKNIIEVISDNSSGINAIGVQLYDATKDEILEAQNKEEMNPVFSSDENVGDVIYYENSTTGGAHGYSCPIGYAIDASVSPPVCVQRYSSNVFYAGKYGLLYNAYAIRECISNGNFIVPSNSDWQQLIDYLIANGYNYDGSISENKIAKSIALDVIGGMYWSFSSVAGAVGNTDYASKRNSSKLSLVPSSFRYNNTNDEKAGSFYNTRGCLLWSSTTINYSGIDYNVYLEIAVDFIDLRISPAATLNQVGGAVRLVNPSTALSHGEMGTYTGNDGKTYPTICIGTQEWLMYNLAETEFCNGATIPYHGENNNSYFTNAEWAALTTAGVCAYNNDWSNVGEEFVMPEVVTITTTTIPPPTTTTTTANPSITTTTTTVNPLVTTTTTTLAVFSFEVKYGNFPNDACDGIPLTIYASTQYPTVNTIMYLDAALTQPYNISGGGAVKFMSPNIFPDAVAVICIVPYTYSMGQIMAQIPACPTITTTTTINPLVTTTTTTINYAAYEREYKYGLYHFITKNILSIKRELDISNLAIGDVQLEMMEFCGSRFSFREKTLAHGLHFPKGVDLFVGLPVYKTGYNYDSTLFDIDTTVIIDKVVFYSNGFTVIPCGEGQHVVIRIEGGVIAGITTINI